jgi:hypothetical protein
MTVLHCRPELSCSVAQKWKQKKVSAGLRSPWMSAEKFGHTPDAACRRFLEDITMTELYASL